MQCSFKQLTVNNTPAPFPRHPPSPPLLFPFSCRHSPFGIPGAEPPGWKFFTLFRTRYTQICAFGRHSSIWIHRVSSIESLRWVNLSVWEHWHHPMWPWIWVYECIVALVCFCTILFLLLFFYRKWWSTGMIDISRLTMAMRRST
jgi:hypothetical protein